MFGYVLQYFIDIGSAKVVKDDEFICNIGEGDFFGEGSFLGTVASFVEQSEFKVGTIKRKRTASIVATDMCRCLELTVKHFLTVFQSDATSRKAIMRLVPFLPVLTSDVFAP